MTAQAPSSNSSGTRKWSKLLIASLALNLLVVGAIAGSVVAGRHRGALFQGPMRNMDGLMGFARTLPKERRLALRSTVEGDLKNMKVLRQSVFVARETATTALTAEPFDGENLKTAVTRLLDVEAAARRAGAGIMLTAVSQMTPQEQ